MSKKNNRIKILYIVLIAIFAVLLLFVRGQRVYKDTLKEAYEVIPTYGSGFTMQVVEKNITNGDGEASIIASLRPGDVYDGSLLIKNHDSRAGDFIFPIFGDLGRFVDPNGDVKITMELDPDTIHLLSGEWAIIHYKITIPEDLPYGDYEGLISLRRDETVERNGISLTYAVGVNVKLNVAEEPVVHQYQTVIQDIELKEFSMNAVFADLKRSIGGFFVILTIYFLYKTATTKKDK